MSDVETVLSEPVIVTLESGRKVQLERLQLRQFLRALKIVTHGVGSIIGTFRVSLSDSDDVLTEKILYMLFYAVPDAEQETIDFLTSMILPADLIKKPVTKQDREKNAEKINALLEEMDNPSPEDTFTLIEAIVKQEVPNLKSFGKRLGKLLSLAQKTGQVPEGLISPTSQAPTSSESSAEASTSSSPSMDGQTGESSTSPSPDSDRSSQPSLSGVG